jgi:hypothetical protein
MSIWGRLWPDALRFSALLGVVALASCGTLPEPFYGNPGAEGAKLAIPPAPVLVIPTPSRALLSDDAAKLFAGDLAAALVALDVPTITGPADKTDWLIDTTAALSGSSVTPHYAVIGPGGKVFGARNGAPVPAADWASGNPYILNAEATTDALAVSKLLAVVNAAIQQSDPESLENRTPRVFFTGVTGAPGDGDNSLALNMNRDLPNLGFDIAATPAQADFTIDGAVKTKPDQGGQTLVEIDWSVHDNYKRKIGQVTQLHDLNLADITPYWGDVAAAAAQEGATGIQQVIQNDRLKKTN